MSTINFEVLRKSFPVAGQTLYANTAAIGLMSEELLEWRQEHDLDFLIGGSDMKMESFQMISGVRDTLGKFLGCHRQRIALLPNFSLGLNLLLEGLPRESRVLLLKTDYPSVNWPFESRGFPISYAPLDFDLEEQIDKKLKEEGVDVLAFSLVQWENGLRIDPEFIRYLRDQYPDLLLIADGTQFCGAHEFNFDTSGLDVLGGSGYKWLLAGTGNGYMLFSEKASGRLFPKSTGFNAVNGNLEEKGQIRLPKHLEPGHLDSLCFGSLGFSVNRLTDWGAGNIERYNSRIIEKAMESLISLGLLREEVGSRKVHGNILNIRGDDRLFEYLVRNEVCCSQRGGGIRLSFHLYNNESEIDRLTEILKSADPSLTSPEK
ncbi:Selenocysteine lyase/Cysteine desulfurase [Muriicola jejuensis]|uniref:Aminotransferase class V-fold PLP-dependent enzyme n=1 Tax=Muriicola jejuensis TaxID=504488 RepID=A0A6P0U834_9FLAO|nr:aminotransferase class V-fold PLP-dependent enzyme [Muriicola jejuensis]NER09411.1 aminotransferase class V-fold PLP-dependent enzyme [Muriicola jejuensis]SMP08817.1 Selenocysteine lyase/Cysteine desulfurase [Muriicola jejuensis]